MTEINSTTDDSRDEPACMPPVVHRPAGAEHVRMRRRRDRWVARKLAGQVFDALGTGMGWLALGYFVVWQLVPRYGWPTAVTVGAIGALLLTVGPAVVDWWDWRRDRSSELDEHTLDSLALTAVEGIPTSAQDLPWRRRPSQPSAGATHTDAGGGVDG